jgi:hypothetical protein
MIRRRQAVCIILALVTGFLSVPALSSGSAPVRPIGYESDALSVAAYLTRAKMDGQISVLAQSENKIPPRLDLGGIKKTDSPGVRPKSPFKAFMLSFIVPGAGQVYMGSEVKAAVFLGLEALSWTGYFVYHNRGNERTDEFNLFADTHWSENRYGDFLFSNWEVRDDDSVFSDFGGYYFTHHLPDTKTQQYYEMIGKYDQFVFGWDDVDTVATPPTSANLRRAYSANRMTYEEMRHKANQMYGRATASLIAMMVNHVVSGVEAALAARSHNKRIDDPARNVTIKAVTAELNGTHFPMLTVAYRF